METGDQVVVVVILYIFRDVCTVPERRQMEQRDYPSNVCTKEGGQIAGTHVSGAWTNFCQFPVLISSISC